MKVLIARVPTDCQSGGDVTLLSAVAGVRIGGGRHVAVRAPGQELHALSQEMNL